MTDAPLTAIERWALELIGELRSKLRRAPEIHEVCFGLRWPRERAVFRAAVRRLQRKGYLALPKPAVQPLRLTARGRRRA
jgi:hypothetical protein